MAATSTAKPATAAALPPPVLPLFTPPPTGSSPVASAAAAAPAAKYTTFDDFVKGLQALVSRVRDLDTLFCDIMMTDMREKDDEKLTRRIAEARNVFTPLTDDADGCLAQCDAKAKAVFKEHVADLGKRLDTLHAQKGLVTDALKLLEEFNKMQRCYQDAHKSGGHSLSFLQDLQTRVAVFFSTPKLPTSLLTAACRFHNKLSTAIQQQLTLQLNMFFRSVLLYQALPSAKRVKESGIVNLYRALPSDTRAKLEGKIWELAGSPIEADFGKKHVLTDCKRLMTALFSLDNFPRFHFEDIVVDCIEQLGHMIPLPATGAHDAEQSEKNATIVAYCKELIALLPPERLNQVYAAVYDQAAMASGFSTTDPDFGKNNLWTDLPRLVKALRSLLVFAPDDEGDDDFEGTSAAKSLPIWSFGATAAASVPKPRSPASSPLLSAYTALAQKLATYKSSLGTALSALSTEQRNAHLIAYMEGSASPMIARTLEQAECDRLYGELFNVVRPTTMDPQWGRNNLAAHFDQFQALVTAKIGKLRTK